MASLLRRILAKVIIYCSIEVILLTLKKLQRDSKDIIWMMLGVSCTISNTVERLCGELWCEENSPFLSNSENYCCFHSFCVCTRE